MAAQRIGVSPVKLDGGTDEPRGGGRPMEPLLPAALLLPALLDVATYLVWSMGAVVVLGPMALLKTVRLPARLGIQEVKEAELDDAQRRWFAELDGLLGSQGFRPALTCVAAGLPSKNLSRLYLSTGDPTIAVASAVSDTKQDVRLAKSYVEFAADFQDGTSVLTTPVLEQGGLVAHPQARVFRHPRLRNPLALKQKHDEHLRPLLARGARFYTAEQLAEVVEADHARKMEHNVALKRWRRDGDAYRLTFRNALRVVAQYLNPFSEQAWDVRVAIALVLALIPSLGAIVLGVAQPAWQPWAQSLSPGLQPGIAWLCVFTPVVLLGAAVLGAVLEARAVTWVFFFHLAENGALGPDGRSTFESLAALAVILAGVKTAGWTSNLVNTRRQLV
jgi:hypothetical protein